MREFSKNGICKKNKVDAECRVSNKASQVFFAKVQGQFERLIGWEQVSVQ